MERKTERIYDEYLVVCCQGGDQRAFERLVRRWQPKLARQAWRLTGNRDAVPDVVQEAWLAIARRLSSLDDPAHFPGWALRIVRNKAVDWVRHRQRQRSAERALENDVAPEPAAQQHSVLSGALAELSREHRAVLSLYYVEQLTVTEISEALHVPRGTVKSRLFHARRHLKSRLTERGPQ